LKANRPHEPGDVKAFPLQLAPEHAHAVDLEVQVEHLRILVFIAISLGRPVRLPASISTFFTQSNSVCAELPILAEIEWQAVQWEE